MTPGLIDGFGGVGLPAPARAPAAAPASGAACRRAEPAARSRRRRWRSTACGRPTPLKARDSGITTALVIPREGVLPGRSVLLNLAGDRPRRWCCASPRRCTCTWRPAARQYPGSLMGTMAYARQALLRRGALSRGLGGLREGAARAEAPALRRRRSRPWQRRARGALPLIVTAPRENDVRRALALADEFKIKVVVGGRPAGGARWRSCSRRASCRSCVSVNFDPPARGDASSAAPTRSRSGGRSRRRSATRPSCTRPACRSRSSPATRPTSLAGMRKAIEKGLPREAALRAAHAGRGRGARASPTAPGSLEPGKIAERGRLVGRAAREGHEGAAGVRGRPALRARRRGQARRRQGRRATSARRRAGAAAEAGDAPFAAAGRPPPAPSRRGEAPSRSWARTILTVGPAGHDREGHAR